MEQIAFAELTRHVGASHLVARRLALCESLHTYVWFYMGICYIFAYGNHTFLLGDRQGH